MKKTTPKFIHDLNKFKQAWEDLSVTFDNKYMEQCYPFNESFDEMYPKIKAWVNESIERYNNHVRFMFEKMYYTSKVEFTPSQAEKHFGHEFDDYIKVLVYIDNYYILVTKECKYLVNFISTSKLFENLKEAEDFFFKNFISGLYNI